MFDGYQWEMSSPPLSEASVFPSFLLTEIADRQARARKAGVNPAVSESGKVTPGGRNAFLFSVGSSLKFKGLPHDVIEAVLFVVNEKMCDPPHEESEVVRVARDAFRSNPVKPESPTSKPNQLDAWVAMVKEGRRD